MDNSEDDVDAQNDDINQKLQKPEKLEDVDCMTNVVKLGQPWVSQFEVADLNQLNLPSVSTLQAQSVTSAENLAYYTYTTPEV